MTIDQIKHAAHVAGHTALEAGPKHDTIARAQDVARGRQAGLFLAEGLWLNRQAMEYRADVQALYICPELLYTEEWSAAVLDMAARVPEVYIISEKTYDRLSEDKSDCGVLGIVRLPQWRLDDIQPGARSTVLVLDGLENPGNVGTLIRSADGAGTDAVLLCNRKTGLNNRGIVRASLCTLLLKPVLEVSEGEAQAWLAALGYTVYLGKAEADGRYCDIAYAERAAIVVGHEKYGVGQGWFAQPHVGVSIPMLGHVDSLNVAVAGSILLYEAQRSRKLFGE